MHTLVSPTAVRFDEATMWVSLSDGRILGMPLAWYPRLLGAASNQLNDVELSPSGLHWDSLDEDLSIDGMLRGLGAHSQRSAAAA
jgi:hypothetical protein